MKKFGLGLYSKHTEEILKTLPKSVGWFEIISENYMGSNNGALYYLDKLRSHYPIAMHGVSLSIGGAEPLNSIYLRDLKQLIDHVQPIWVSDHFCFSHIDDIYTHELLPLPYTEECIDFLVERIRYVQDYLGQQILLENVSSYIQYDHSTIPEWEFICAVANKADCFLLLDINNIYVNGFNHQFSPKKFLASMSFERVKEFHVAGHKKTQEMIIDTHGASISPEVFDLYRATLQYTQDPIVLLERDNNTPSLHELLDELHHLEKIYNDSIRKNT